MQTSFVAQGILVSLITALTQLTGSRFDVLFAQGSNHIVGDKFVLGHYIRFQPDTHGVVLSQYHGIAHTVDTFHLRDKVDVGVVFQELDVVLVFFIIDGEYHQHGSLAFTGGYTDFGNFGRQQALRHGNAVLYVHRCHIGVGTLLEVDGDVARTAVGGARTHIHHIFHTVNLVLQRSDNGVKHRLGIGTLVSRTYRYGGRCNVRVLGDRQGSQTNNS